jgi:leucyl-tRNA synthetase
MWTKVMFDEGMINFKEPFTTLRNQGMILAPDGQKMSKSKGNTIEPDSLIEQGYGADSIRIMELFIGPWNQMANWSVEGMGGSYRFLQRVWTLVQEYLTSRGGAASVASADPAIAESLCKLTHKAIKKVTQDLHELSFNTAIAALMELVNELYKIKATEGYGNDEWQNTLESLLQLLAPFAPHITEELWAQLGRKESIHSSEWPVFDDKYLVEDSVTIVVQINGKVRAQLVADKNADQASVEAAAKAEPNVMAHLDGKPVVKTIFVPGKLVSFVVK